MSTNLGRRNFLKKSVATTLAAPLVKSLEEYALAADKPAAPAAEPSSAPKATVPKGKIDKVEISRLICGGNLISGYAHSRDLIYVSNLLKAYFTEEKIMDTWAQCEAHGIDTMIFVASDPLALSASRKYRARGGKIQALAQISPKKDAIGPAIREAVDAGIVGAVLVGNEGDAWSREGDFASIGKFLDLAKAQGIIAGVAAHELRTVVAVEKAGLKPDFYMKTLHSTKYWSTRRPDQMQEVIDNYSIDNYWCRDPEDTIRFMAGVGRPWIAYKVLAAGAIHPKAGFQYAFESGADFCVVGMFDFQVAEDVVIASQVVKATEHRVRAWMA